MPKHSTSTERINDLLVALSTIVTLSRDARADARTIKTIFDTAAHAIKRDHIRESLSEQEAAPPRELGYGEKNIR